MTREPDKIGKYNPATKRISVETCLACQSAHESEVVIQGSGVYYRCTKTRAIIYIRERKAT